MRNVERQCWFVVINHNHFLKWWKEVEICMKFMFNSFPKGSSQNLSDTPYSTHFPYLYSFEAPKIVSPRECLLYLKFYFHKLILLSFTSLKSHVAINYNGLYSFVLFGYMRYPIGQVQWENFLKSANLTIFYVDRNLKKKSIKVFFWKSIS